jgi:DNA-binding PadR family transcriptional regulator
VQYCLLVAIASQYKKRHIYEKHDFHGRRDWAKAIDERLEFRIPEGTMYTTLQRMVEDGWIIRNASGFYTLTEHGAVVLALAVRFYHEFFRFGNVPTSRLGLELDEDVNYWITRLKYVREAFRVST